MSSIVIHKSLEDSAQSRGQMGCVLDLDGLPTSVAVRPVMRRYLLCPRAILGIRSNLRFLGRRRYCLQMQMFGLGLFATW